MQLAEGVKEPEAELPKLTEPEGVTKVPTSLSVTVAVQVVGAFTGTVAGMQTTLVEVVRLLAVRLKLLELER